MKQFSCTLVRASWPYTYKVVRAVVCRVRPIFYFVVMRYYFLVTA